MSESSKETIEVEDSTNVENQVLRQAEVSPVDLQQQWENLQGLTILHPGVKDSDEYKAIEARMKDAVDRSAKTSTKQSAKKEEYSEDEETRGEEKEGKATNPFGLKTNKQNSKQPNPALDKIDQEALKEVVKSFGAEDPNKFFEEIIPKWRTDSQSLAKVQEDYDGLNEELGKLPDDLKTALLAYANGHDWRESVAAIGSRPDFNQAYEKLDKQNVVKFYYPDKYKSLLQKFEDGDYDEEDLEERIDMLRDAAKPLFERDKGQFENKRADIMRNAEESEKNLRTSVSGSVDALKKEYPDFSNAEIQRIRQFLVKGNVEDLLKEKNGAYKENAAKFVAFALYGEDLVKDLLNQAENRGESKANLEIVERGKKTIQSSKAIENAEKQATNEAVRHLSYMQQSKNPYA
jgi:hypothetical protein